MTRQTKVASILDSLSGAEIKQLSAMLAKMGEGGDTILAHITPAEAAMLRNAGGTGAPNPKTGLPAFNDGDGDGDGGDGGASSDNGNSNSEAGAQDAAGGNDGTGAGPSGAGASGNSTDAGGVGGAGSDGGAEGYSEEDTSTSGLSKDSTTSDVSPTNPVDNQGAGPDGNGESSPALPPPPPPPAAAPVETPRPVAMDIPTNGGSDARRIRRASARDPRVGAASRSDLLIRGAGSGLSIPT